MKKLLILGGTQFIGRVLVEELLKRETTYDITLFNRGKTNANLFSDLPKIQGDRETDDLLKTAQQDWDVVLDISGYYPNSIEQYAKALKGKVGRYIFVSTCSVYDLPKLTNQVITEDSALLPCTAEQRIDTTMQTYGQRKIACENALLASDLDVVILRPSIVYGRYDLYDRHYHWLHRIQHQEAIIMPDGGTAQATYTYVVDLANALIAAITLEQHQSVYNITTHPIITHKTLLDTMMQVVGKTPEQVNISSEWLREQSKIMPINRMFLPLWTGEDSYLMLDSSRLTQDFALDYTDLGKSLQATVDYYANLGWQNPVLGYSLVQEQDLIKQWNALT